jgi:hypothetical protein
MINHALLFCKYHESLIAVVRGGPSCRAEPDARFRPPPCADVENESSTIAQASFTRRSVSGTDCVFAELFRPSGITHAFGVLPGLPGIFHAFRMPSRSSLSWCFKARLSVLLRPLLPIQPGDAATAAIHPNEQMTTG